MVNVNVISLNILITESTMLDQIFLILKSLLNCVQITFWTIIQKRHKDYTIFIAIPLISSNKKNLFAGASMRKFSFM